MTRRRCAFTLLEALIALGLGIVLAGTAFVAARVALSASSTCQALSTQNAMIRAGMLAALAEVDHWTCYDDPADPARQRLRAIGDATATPQRALPFTPLKAVFPKVGWDGGEDDRGWDKDYHWPAGDPRTWWRGDLIESGHSDLRFGRYAIFSAISSPLALPAIDVATTFVGTPGGFSGSAWRVTLPDYGTVDVPHTWLPNQIAALSQLGFYGMAEYLPLNTTFAWYDEYIPWAAGRRGTEYTNLGGIRMAWVGGGSSEGSAAVFNQDRTRGMPAQLPIIEEYTVAPIPFNAFTRTWDAASLAAWTHCRYTTGYLLNAQVIDTYGQSLIKQAIDRTFTRDPLMAIRPAHWPQVEVIVHRGLFRRRFNTYCKVAWTSPVTGESAQLDFSAFGTSLRGARQQRGLDDY